MTSFIAAGGSGRSTSVIPAVPAASSVTTIAFMGIVSSLICLFGGTRTNAVCHLQAQLSTALLRGGGDLRPTAMSQTRRVRMNLSPGDPSGSSVLPFVELGVL